MNDDITINKRSDLHKLIDAHFSLIPIADGKKNPHHILGGGHTLLDRLSTHDELDQWLSAGVTSWGLANGAVSNNLVTLDFDEKNYEGLYDLFYQKLSKDQKEVIDTCVISRTRNGGRHVRYFTETPQPTTKLALRVIEEKIETTAEVRGQGAYALMPPSDGYSFIQGDFEKIPKISDDLHEQFIDIMRVFNEVVEEPETPYEHSGGSPTGDRPGDRYNATASWSDILSPHGWVEEYKDHWRRPGKKEGEGISATTNYDGRPFFYIFSTAATPFKENRGYSKFHAYTLLSHQGDFSKAAKELVKSERIIDGKDEFKPKRDTHADQLIAIVEKKEKVMLFHNEKDDGYISVKVGDHQEVMSMKSRAMGIWLTKAYWDIHKKAVSPESLKGAIAVLIGKACFDGPLIPLYNRLAWKDGDLWYDLTNDKWQAVRVTKEGWKIVDEPPILFHKSRHSSSQDKPLIQGGDIKLLLKYVNITDPEHQLLLLIYLVSCFIPDFPHPIIVVFGSHGSAKSTLARLLRLLIDPSLIDVASMPHNHKELVQALAHHTFLFFDNVSYISESTSDTLSKAITGGGFIKRELYTDDEDIIYSIKRCIGINGINLVSTKPDLLDRSLLIELERIDDSKRKEERVLKEEFMKDRSSILGGIFDILSKALGAHSTIKMSTFPRMADFAQWGCAIAQAMGYTKEDFLKAYQNNINIQKETILNDDVVAMVLVAYMDDRSGKKWEGTMTDLLQELTEQASFINVDTREKYWPKAPSKLSNKLNVLKAALSSAGYSIVCTHGQIRKVTIERRAEGTKQVETAPVTNSLLANDDTTIATIQS